uniref:Uncharacterized protein n=1 Tax=Setaria viridis TaxID=4556 RepID=A0A4U6VBB1_SETVI|nr:hypothetical protein SEVIR_3G047250v2 [Setaria viridis]
MFCSVRCFVAIILSCHCVCLANTSCRFHGPADPFD